jgi:hypothetical protein
MRFSTVFGLSMLSCLSDCGILSLHTVKNEECTMFWRDPLPPHRPLGKLERLILPALLGLLACCALANLTKPGEILGPERPRCPSWDACPPPPIPIYPTIRGAAPVPLSIPTTDAARDATIQLTQRFQTTDSPDVLYQWYLQALREDWAFIAPDSGGASMPAPWEPWVRTNGCLSYTLRITPRTTSHGTNVTMVLYGERSDYGC